MFGSLRVCGQLGFCPILDQLNSKPQKLAVQARGSQCAGQHNFQVRDAAYSLDHCPRRKVRRFLHIHLLTKGVPEFQNIQLSL